MPYTKVVKRCSHPTKTFTQNFRILVILQDPEKLHHKWFALKAVKQRILKFRIRMPEALIEGEAAANTKTYSFKDKLRADCLAERSKTFCGLNPCFDITNFLDNACTGKQQLP
jgi:hypothetical protein